MTGRLFWITARKCSRQSPFHLPTTSVTDRLKGLGPMDLGRGEYNDVKSMTDHLLKEETEIVADLFGDQHRR